VPPLSTTIIDLTDNHTVGKVNWPAGDSASGAQGDPMGGLDCHPDVAAPIDITAHVSVFVNGEATAFPGQVGIVKKANNTTCVYAIHTHNSSGKLHVKSDAAATYTLGQLFSIWGEPLENTNLAGLTGMPIVIYVTDNGVVTEVDSDWQNIELMSHREITIQVGTPISEIPNYTWAGN
jgi:hypothetical protein